LILPKKYAHKNPGRFREKLLSLANISFLSKNFFVKDYHILINVFKRRHKLLLVNTEEKMCICSSLFQA